MNLLYKDNKVIENTYELGQALVELIEENLHPNERGFYKTYTNFSERSGQIVIYDSMWCRVCFHFSRQRSPKYDELSVDYGRFHPLNEEPYIEWEGERCRCWHQVWEPLFYLDGLSPSEAVQKREIYKQLPIVAENFWNSYEGKSLREVYPPKYNVVLQSVLWEHYGQRLFGLFDLRKPDLWQGYRRFLREYYGLLGERPSFGPPYENVC